MERHLHIYEIKLILSIIVKFELIVLKDKVSTNEVGTYFVFFQCPLPKRS